LTCPVCDCSRASGALRVGPELDWHPAKRSARRAARMAIRIELYGMMV
jgi:hypothetical protein